jgi:hypothetical protein
MEELEVYSFKLISGEEIISKVFEEGDNYFSLKDARMLMMSQNGNLSLMPVIMFAADPDKLLTLNKSAIAFQSKYIREELKTGYLSSVSKLIIPNKSIIMG